MCVMLTLLAFRVSFAHSSIRTRLHKDQSTGEGSATMLMGRPSSNRRRCILKPGRTLVTNIRDGVPPIGHCRENLCQTRRSTTRHASHEALLPPQISDMVDLSSALQNFKKEACPIALAISPLACS